MGTIKSVAKAPQADALDTVQGYAKRFSLPIKDGKYLDVHDTKTQEAVASALRARGEQLAPRSVHLEIARLNGMADGLPVNHAPMDRAKALGLEDGVYHATSADIKAFNPEMYGTNTRASGDELGIFTTAKTDLANSYAEIAGRGGWYGRRDPGNANVMPLMARMQNPKKYETASGFYRDVDKAAAARELGQMRQQLQDKGFDAVQVRPDMEEVVLFHPNQLRSRFAAFDPARINENDLLGRVNLPMLGLLGAGGLGGAYLLRPEE
jgi:hypothetical protein